MEQIKQSTLDFLSDLKRNNERDWFIKNRKRYDDARMNYETFVQAVIDEISEFDPIIRGLEAKSCTYRINRDIRFSNDKTIYKTHLGAFIVKGGKKNSGRVARARVSSTARFRLLPSSSPAGRPLWRSCSSTWAPGASAWWGCGTWWPSTRWQASTSRTPTASRSSL